MNNLRLLTVDEVAKILRCEKTTVYGLLKTKKILSKRIGRHYRITQKALADFLEISPADIPEPEIEEQEKAS